MIKEFHTPAAALTSGALVQLGTCPRHGSAMVRTRKRRFTSPAPSWLILFVFISLLVGLIIAVALQKKVRGLLPECATCVRDHGRWKRSTWTAWGATAGLIVLSIALQSSYLALAWFVTLLAALVLTLMRPRYEQTAFVSKDGLWLTFKKVNDAWAGAASERMAAAAAAPPPAWGAPTGPGLQ